EDRRRPGEDEDASAASLDLPRVARVLVALELPDEPVAGLAVEETAHGHERAVVRETPHGRLEEARVELGVRVHDEHGVVVAELGQQLAQELVERARLALGVPDGLEDLAAVR